MLAVKGYYKDGRIEIIEPLPPDIKEAELNIVIIPKEEREKKYIPMDSFRITHDDSEKDFRMLGMYNFFDAEDDRFIDWEEHFGLRK
ncbi:MAG: hypothetical protein HY761_07050 [Candidatus Omnitrophica bacterium]|nr:hypothetical protein [Candidatus Omnitrophota bacterium]